MGQKPKEQSQLTAVIVEAIKQKASQKKIQDKELAEMAQVSAPTLSRIFSGTRELYIDELVLICKGLGVKTFEVIKEAEAIVRRQSTPDHFTLAASEREPDPYEGLGEESQE